jgi:hypothetical protein
VPRAHQHPGCEFLYLLTGTLDVRHGDAIHRVEAGDAIYFDANTTHSYMCSGKTPAAAVIVTLQNPLVLQTGPGGRTIGPGNGKVRSIPPPMLPPGMAKKSSERMQ